MTGLSSGQRAIIALLQRQGFPVTRENYIDAAWDVRPNPWDAEAEAELPPFLQVPWDIDEGAQS